MLELRDNQNIGWMLYRDTNDVLGFTQTCETSFYSDDKDVAKRVFELHEAFMKANLAIKKLYGQYFLDVTYMDYEGVGWIRSSNRCKSLIEAINDNEITERVSELAGNTLNAIGCLQNAVEDTLKAGQTVERELIDFIASYNCWIDYDNSFNNMPESMDLEEGMNEEPSTCEHCDTPRQYIGLKSYNNKHLAYCKICKTCEE